MARWHVIPIVAALIAPAAQAQYAQPDARMKPGAAMAPQYAPPGQAPQFYAPPPGYAVQEPQGYVQGPQGYVPQPQGYAPAPQGYAAPPQGYVPAPQGFMPAPQGYGQAPQGYMQAPQGYVAGPQGGFQGGPQGGFQGGMPPASPGYAAPTLRPSPSNPFAGLTLPTQRGDGAYQGGGVVLEQDDSGMNRRIR